jgi:hypothetical protein
MGALLCFDGPPDARAALLEVRGGPLRPEDRYGVITVVESGIVAGARLRGRDASTDADSVDVATGVLPGHG